MDFQATRAAQRPKHVAPASYGWKVLPAAPAVYLVGRKESPGVVWKVCEAAAGGQQQLHSDELCRTVSSKYLNSSISVRVGVETSRLWPLFMPRTLLKGFKGTKAQSRFLLFPIWSSHSELIAVFSSTVFAFIQA